MNLIDQPQRDKPVVLCMGCSFTNNAAGVFPKKNYPFHLAKLAKKDYIVCNSGVGGSGTWLHLLLAEYFPVSVDLVVIQLMESGRHPELIRHREFIRELPHIMRSAELNVYNSTLEKVVVFFTAISGMWHEIMGNLFGEEATRGNWPYCCAERICRDIMDIAKLRSLYDCPFIFLVNRLGFPFEHHTHYAISGIKENVLQPNDQICMTDFRGLLYQVSEDDGHPNALRAKMTGYQLAPLIGKMLK
jgi:hypothetical protein